MKKRQKSSGLLRGGAIISVSAILLSGVTFAALRSQNNLVNGSHLVSASANLQITKQANSTYASTIAGYDFLNIAPGGAPGPSTGNDIYFRNFGTTNLDLRISLNPARLLNPNGADLKHAYLVIVDSADSTTQFGKYSLTDLSTAYTSGNPLPVNIVIGTMNPEHLQLRMQLDDNVTSTATLSPVELQNIDLVFSGVSV